MMSTDPINLHQCGGPGSSNAGGDPVSSVYMQARSSPLATVVDVADIAVIYFIFETYRYSVYLLWGCNKASYYDNSKWENFSKLELAFPPLKHTTMYHL